MARASAAAQAQGTGDATANPAQLADVTVRTTALEDAASVASLLITTEAMIADRPEPKAAPAMPGGGGMGGMDF